LLATHEIRTRRARSRDDHRQRRDCGRAARDAALAAADKSYRIAAGALFTLASNYPQFGTSAAFSRCANERDARGAGGRKTRAVQRRGQRAEFPVPGVSPAGSRSMGLRPAPFLS
jgi:hypothetical protein